MILKPFCPDRHLAVPQEDHPHEVGEPVSEAVACVEMRGPLMSLADTIGKGFSGSETDN